MFTNKFKSALIAGAVVFGTLISMNTSANAGGRVSLSIGGPGYDISFRGGDRWDRRRHTCRPGKALRKARRRGIRYAYVARVGRRGIIVKGRKWGERVTMGFAHGHRCPVRFVRAR